MSNEEILEHLLTMFDVNEVITFCEVNIEYHKKLYEEHHKKSNEPCENEYDEKWWKDTHRILLELNS